MSLAATVFNEYCFLMYNFSRQWYFFYKNNQMTGEFCQQKILIVLKKSALLNLIVIVYSNDFLHLVFLNEIPFLHVLMIVRPCHFLEREVL